MSGAADACVISPFKRTALYSDQLLEKSDVMFFGRLNSEVFDESTSTQTAVFTVIKSYKGDVAGEVVVSNKLVSSCSRAFQVLQSAFYVFAIKGERPNTYALPRSATFIPLGNAIEYEWSPE
ncbi:hypothetical protein R50072_36800 [Simiduia litorea]